MKKRPISVFSTAGLSEGLKRACLISIAVLSIGSAMPNYFRASADQYDEQIKALESQNSQYNQEAQSLRFKANSLAEEVAILEAEKSAIQDQINKTTDRINELKSKIEETIIKIEANRVALGEVLASIYLSDQISPLERLASSKDITTYIDEEAERNTLQNSLTSKVKEIDSFKKELESQKIEVEATLKTQEEQHQILAQKEAEKQSVLNQTRGDEATYRTLATENNARISQLRADQAEAIRRAMGNTWGSVPAGVPGGGGYPGVWASAPLDAYVDTWGLYTRECVSYTAWKVWSTGRFVPHFGGRGNAKEWPSTTAAYGIPNGSTPKVGSVAVWYVGYYGHVMYVEKVNGDGTIDVSDYNLGWDGLYRYYTRSASGLTYIYF